MASMSKPVKHQMKVTPQVKDAVVEYLSQTGNLEASAAAAGVHPRTVYNHIYKDEEFKERIEQARAKACHAIESEIARRGLHGINKPVFYQGEKVAEQKEYSDKLLLAMARANMGARYSERQHIVTQHLGHDDCENAKHKLIKLLEQEDIVEGEYTEVADSREENNDS